MAIDTGNPKVQKALLVLLLAAGGLYFFYTYVFQPRSAELAGLAAEVERQELELRAAQAVAASADTLELARELERMEREIAMVESLLPEREGLPALLEEISLVGRERGVEFTRFEPQGPVQHEFYQERSYRLGLRGGFHQAAQFLSEVAALRRIVRPQGVEIVRETRQERQPEETMLAECTLTTYLMIPAPPGWQPAKEK